MIVEQSGSSDRFEHDVVGLTFEMVDIRLFEQRERQTASVMARDIRCALSFIDGWAQACVVFEVAEKRWAAAHPLWKGCAV